MMAARGWLRRVFKGLEHRGRLLLVRAFARLLRAPTLPVPALASNRPLRLLVIRLDPRLGNVLMTTPLLVALRKQFADAAIDCLVSPYAARVLHEHPTHVRALAFRRWAWLGQCGPLRRLRALRRQRYDLCIDATNPTQPSVTQALIARLSGAACTIGYDLAPVAPLYNVRVPSPAAPADDAHEIERRLRLLAPLGIKTEGRLPSVGPLALQAREQMALFLETLRETDYVVINLGARASARRVSPADGATVANLCKTLGFLPVLVCGPGEHALCEAVRGLSLDVIQAPPANLADLALLCTHASAFVSGDTGPMHLAVALGCPTLGIFSNTSPQRYGYANAPHGCIDARQMDSLQWAPLVRHFLAACRLADVATAPAPAPRTPLRARAATLHAARAAAFAGRDHRA